MEASIHPEISCGKFQQYIVVRTNLFWIINPFKYDLSNQFFSPSCKFKETNMSHLLQIHNLVCSDILSREASQFSYLPCFVKLASSLQYNPAEWEFLAPGICLCSFHKLTWLRTRFVFTDNLYFQVCKKFHSMVLLMILFHHFTMSLDFPKWGASLFMVIVVCDM